MQNTLNLLIFLISVIFTQQTVCDTKDIKTYKCLEGKVNDKRCMIIDYSKQGDIKTTAYMLKNCDSSENCQEFMLDATKDNYNYGLCIPNHLEKSEGEKCIENNDCKTRICTNSKCSGIADGQSCVSSSNCMNGSFCIGTDPNKKCEKAKGANEACEYNEYNCPIGYQCGSASTSADNTCIPMFSIDVGQFTTYPTLCKSGFMAHPLLGNYDPFNPQSNLNTICAEAKLSSGNEKCSSDSDCLYEITGISSKIQGTCICSVNGVDNYCEIGTDNVVWTNWIQTYKDTVADIKDKGAKAIYDDKDDNLGYLDLMRADQLRRKYAFFKGGDECAIKYHMNSRMFNISIISLLISLILLL